MISISKISKELNIQPYQLRDWEKRGWLGADPILKDPENNNQRIYNEHQVERIHFIQKELQRQRQEGIKRTDVSEMNSKLLDQFGGEVLKIDKNELTVHSSSVEEMAKLIIDLSKKVSNCQYRFSFPHYHRNKIPQ